MRKIYDLILIFLLAAVLTGCSEKEPEVGAKEDVSVKLRLGHVGHDHHLALFVAFDNASEYSRRARCIAT